MKHNEKVDALLAMERVQTRLQIAQDNLISSNAPQLDVIRRARGDVARVRNALLDEVRKPRRKRG